MALPFILGLVIGGGAMYAYSNKDELQKQLKAKSKDLKAGLKKGEETLGKVSNSLKAGAKSINNRIKRTADKTQTKKHTRKPRVAKQAQTAKVATEATQVTLIPDSTAN